MPSKVELEIFESVHSITTASRCVAPKVRIAGVTVYPAVFKPGKFLLSGRLEAGSAGVFQVDRVELAVVGVVGVELKADESARQQVVDGQPVKDSRLALEPVEVQIGGELLRFLVEDVQRVRSGR